MSKPNSHLGSIKTGQDTTNSTNSSYYLVGNHSADHATLNELQEALSVFEDLISNEIKFSSLGASQAKVTLTAATSDLSKANFASVAELDNSVIKQLEQNPELQQSLQAFLSQYKKLKNLCQLVDTAHQSQLMANEPEIPVVTAASEAVTTSASPLPLSENEAQQLVASLDSSYFDLSEELAPSSEQDLLPIFALIRFNNEVVTLKQCLNSLLPTIKYGVLITHRNSNGLEDDGSLAVALDFVGKNPGFKLLVYPHVVYHANHPVYQELLPRESYLDAYTSFGLQSIQEYALQLGIAEPWVFKVDADHIYDPQLLQRQFKQIAEQDPEGKQVHLFTKLDCHYDRQQQQLYYLRTQQKNSCFLCKLKYVQVGMHINKSDDAPVVAHEIYIFEDHSLTKLNFKQSLKALSSYLQFRFVGNNSKAREFKHTSKVHNPNLAFKAQDHLAQTYALGHARQIPLNQTNFINSLHFKYLKFVEAGLSTNPPQGIKYQDFLASADYRNLCQLYPELASSSLFNNLELLNSYCQNFDFKQAEHHKLLQDIYAAALDKYLAG